MTHEELVQKSAKWLKKHNQNAVVPNCSVIATELKTNTKTGEIPDVIGWNSSFSVLMEIKVSRSDFFKDFQKTFRVIPYKGLGQLRYYVCPFGLVELNEIPHSWGLITYDKGEFTIDKKAIKQDQYNLQDERSILLSILRRKA